MVGARAAYPDAPLRALLCSCRRFGYRHDCGHTTFTETLDIEGFREASVRDMALRGLRL